MMGGGLIDNMSIKLVVHRFLAAAARVWAWGGMTNG